jgi:hypothetical protein
MPSPTKKSVKFEFSLKELTFKFEGDVQIAERIGGEITGALNTLASSQRLLTSGTKPATPAAPATTVLVEGSRRRRRRRGGGAAAGIDPAIIDGITETNGSNGDGATDVDEEPRRAATRRPGAGPSVLITTLKAEGFFATKQTNATIREALANKGHTFKSNEINPVLVYLTKQGQLKREKTADDQWTYFAD